MVGKSNCDELLEEERCGFNPLAPFFCVPTCCLNLPTESCRTLLTGVLTANITNFKLGVVLIVGGYKLTPNLKPVALCLNRWLRQNGIKDTKLRCCMQRGVTEIFSW